ncbi:MAG: hypothetical protein ABI560_10545, partial [Myxococcales bacterium]
DTRINFEGKVTTDSDSDNDVWLVNVATDAVTGGIYLTGVDTPFETIAPNLFIASIGSSALAYAGYAIVDSTFRLARCIADAMSGATSLEKPLGAPRFRSVILVRPSPLTSHA